MHAAERPFLAVICNVGLSDHRLQTVRLKFMLAEDSGKESAGILTALDVNDERAAQLGFRKDHRFVSPPLIALSALFQPA